jgi:hypothetical protein
MLGLVRLAEPAYVPIIRKRGLAVHASVISANNLWIRRPDGHIHSDNHRDEYQCFHTVASLWLQFPRAGGICNRKLAKSALGQHANAKGLVRLRLLDE